MQPSTLLGDAPYSPAVGEPLPKITSRNHPNGWYPHAGWYLSQWKQANAALDAGKHVKVGGWAGDALDREGFARYMRTALDRRINAKGGIEGVGRKYSDHYQTELRRDAYDINRWKARRECCGLWNWRTAEMRKRYGHITQAWREDR